MRSMWRALLLSPLASVVLALSCRSEAGPVASALRRDSSGVAIVESRAPGSQALLQLSAEPIVTIGAVENDSTQLIDGVVNALRLSDGRIVVANRLAPLLRWYD